MMRKRNNTYFWLLLCAWVGVVPAFAQQLPDFMRMDSSGARVLTHELFLSQIRTSHPMARQIYLLGDQALAQRRMALGTFDPKLKADYEDKFFDETNYWRIGQAGIKWQSPIAIELEAGFQYVDGVFVNSERKIPEIGQGMLGVKVPVLRGLWIDEGRAKLRKANLNQQVLEFEQHIQLNQLLFEASLAYWDWNYAYAEQELYQTVVERSQSRFEFVRDTYLAGDAAEIDTVEAFSQLQLVQLGLAEAQINFQKARRLLDSYIWVNLPSLLRPPSIEESLSYVRTLSLPSEDWRDEFDDHPILQQLDYQQQMYEVERRWKAEQLKPQLDLKYQFLSNTSQEESLNWAQAWSMENYKWGVTFQFPLFLRKERAGLENARIKLQQIDWKTDQKEVEIFNKAIALEYQLENLAQQIELFENLFSNYERLLEGENIKFQTGESTIFLLNSRELKLLEAGRKRLSLSAKYLMVHAEWMNLMLEYPL